MPTINPLEFPKNSVDVEGDDGLFHHGRAVGCTEEGILVDFGLEGKKLVPFGQVYLSKRPDFISKIHMDNMIDKILGLEETDVVRPAQVLMRVHSDQPWKWWPATLLAADCDLYNSFGIVRVHLRDRTLEGILPANRIRAPPSNEDLLEFEQGNAIVEHKIAPSNYKRVCTDEGLGYLPLDILVEIFAYVDTIQQVKLRRVCTTWDSVLTLATVTQDLWVTYNWINEYRYYTAFACLYNCWTERIKTMIFADKIMFHVDKDNPDIFYLRTTGLRIDHEKRCETMVLANLTVNWLHLGKRTYEDEDVEHENVWDWLEKLRGHLEHMMLRSPAAIGCRTLLMKNVDFELHCLDRGSDMHTGNSIIMTVTEGRINIGQCKGLGNMWTKLNASVPALDTDGMMLLAEWIHVTGTTDNAELWDIVQILEAVQSSDGRNGVCYQKVKWFPVGLDRIADLDVKKLTKLTQYCLWERYTNRTSRSLIIYVSW